MHKHRVQHLRKLNKTRSDRNISSETWPKTEIGLFISLAIKLQINQFQGLNA